MPGNEVVGREELDEVIDLFNNGAVLARQGFDNVRGNCRKVEEFEKQFATKMSCPGALAVSSGTAAIRIALASLGLKRGDEVITQSFTFVATVEAIIEAGCTPIVADIDYTLNMCPKSLASLISEKTKAVIVVHMLGVPAELRKISAICEQHQIALVEDTAWGCGGSLDGRPLGTWGCVGTYSFDYAKTITTGEGGMVIANSPELMRKARAWHDHGHENNPKVPRWEDTRSGSGFNYRMSELQGAVGVAQLKKLDSIILRQRENKRNLLDKLTTIEGLKFREHPLGSFDTADALIFFMGSPNLALRAREKLVNYGVSTKILPEAYTWHFAGTWSHMPELKTKHGNDLMKSFSHSHEILSRAVSLPISIKMSEKTPELIENAVRDSLVGS